MQESPPSAHWPAGSLPVDSNPTPARSSLYSMGLVSFLLGLAAIWLYFPTFTWLVQRWKADEYYEHGPLLPFISAYLIWQNRDALKLAWSERPAQSLMPSGLIFFALALHWCGSLVEMNSIRALQAFSLPLFLLGLARYLGGKEFQKQLIFPLLFFCLAVPISGPLVEKLTIPMQTYAANASGMLLGLMGMSIEREGVNLYTPLYHFVVAVPCSGLKITITLFTMGLLIAHLMPGLSIMQRVALCLLSVPVALLANTSRVMIIVSLGYHYGTQVAEGFLHSWSGLFMFGLSLVLLIGAGLYMGRVQADAGETPEPPTPNLEGIA
jgi:exosortase